MLHVLHKVKFHAPIHKPKIMPSAEHSESESFSMGRENSSPGAWALVGQPAHQRLALIFISKIRSRAERDKKQLEVISCFVNSLVKVIGMILNCKFPCCGTALDYDLCSDPHTHDKDQGREGQKQL